MKIILFSFYILFSFSLFGQENICSNSIIIDKNFKKENLSNYVSVFHTSCKKSPEYIFTHLKDSAIHKVVSDKLTYGFSEDYFWIFFKIKNNLAYPAELILDLDNPHIDSVYLYELNNTDNTWEFIGKSGDRMAFFERPIPDRRMAFPIKISNNSISVFALMVDKRNASVSYPLKLWKKTYFEKSEQSNNLFYLLYFGGIMFISLFSLVIGIIMKNSRLFTYSVYSGLMGFYLFIALGFAFQYLYPDSTTLNNYIRTQALLLLLISFLVFTISYLRIRENHILSFKILVSIIFTILILFIISTVFKTFAFDNIIIFLKFLYLLIFATFPIIILAVIKTYKKYPFQAKTYILAISLLFLGSNIFNLVEFGIIDESLIPANPILLGSIFELFIFSTAFIIEIKHINDKKNSLLKASAQQQKELLKAYIKGSEEEGTRISQELHDNIGSRLALLKNQVNKYNSLPLKLEDDISEIFYEVKNISNELSPSSLHILGLIKCTKSILDAIQRTTEIKVNFYIEDDFKFDSQKELQLYRVIQEAFHNIIKHSKAKNADIQFFKEDDRIVISIDDDGVGFDTNNANIGNGINNMKMRIESINGILELSSKPGKGTHLMIWI